MAWSPPADKRRIVWVSAPGDYATFNSNHTPDGTAGYGNARFAVAQNAQDSNRGVDTAGNLVNVG
jgi:hypothetical protein